MLVPLPFAQSVGEPSDMLTTSMPRQMLPGRSPGHGVVLVRDHPVEAAIAAPNARAGIREHRAVHQPRPGATPAKYPPGPPVPSAVPAQCEAW